MLSSIHTLIGASACLVTLSSLAPAVHASPAQSATSASDVIPSVHLDPAFPKLSFIRPVFVTSLGVPAGKTIEHLLVLEQPGRVMVFENRADAEKAEVFLDIREDVFDQHNEEGLLSLVLHPKFSENGQVFIFYSATAEGRPRFGRLSRFTMMKDNPLAADRASEKIIFELDKPWGNHNGATILFGTDGYLYLSMGDGGAANDPLNSGQDLGSLLGKILRIDVDREEGGKAYAIPADNPFVGREGAKPEIWAYGLRNVWRMSFDRKTGELWAGDVGQNRYEEVDIIVKGGNYGWRLREGLHAFAEGTSADPLIDPVAEYDHSLGLSITGGYVYRGAREPKLAGLYLYADYATRRMWALRREGSTVTVKEVLAAKDGKYVSSFGEDAAGEVYVCTFNQADRPGTKGRIYRVAAD